MKKLLFLLVLPILAFSQQIGLRGDLVPDANNTRDVGAYNKNIDSLLVRRILASGTIVAGDAITTTAGNFIATTAAAETYLQLANVATWKLTTNGTGSIMLNDGSDRFTLSSSLLSTNAISSGAITASGAIHSDITAQWGELAARKAAIPTSGTLIGIIYSGAYTTGTTFYNSTSIRTYATENWSATAGGSRLEFYTTPNTTASDALAFTIGQDKAFTVTSSVSDTAAFVTTAVRSAIYIPGALTTDKYWATPRTIDTETLPVAGDLLSCWPKADSLIVLRAAGTTSGLKFVWGRFR